MHISFSWVVSEKDGKTPVPACEFDYIELEDDCRSPAGRLLISFRF